MTGRAASTTAPPNTSKTPQTAKQVVAAVCGEGWQSAFDHFAPGPTKGVKPVPGGAAIEEDEIIVTGHRSRGILGWFADRLGDLADMAGLNGIGGQYRTAAGYNPTFNALASTGAVLHEQQGQVQTWVAEHPRVMGAVQMVGGGLQLGTAVVSGGAAVVTSETGVGAVAFGSLAVVAGTNGADNFQAGWRTWWSGVPTETYTHGALRGVGLSNTQASWGEAIIGVGSGFGVAAVGREGLEQLAVAGAQRNAARAWAARGPDTILGPPAVGDLFDGFHPDTMIHITPFGPDDFVDGINTGTYFARLDDVSQMTVDVFRTDVVGPAAPGYGSQARMFVWVGPESGYAFRPFGAPNLSGTTEYVTIQPVAPGGFVRVP